MSDHLMMLWFQKDSLDTVGLRTYGWGSRDLYQKVTFRALNVPLGGGGVTGLRLSPKKLPFYGFRKGVELIKVFDALGLLRRWQCFLNLSPIVIISESLAHLIEKIITLWRLNCWKYLDCKIEV